MIRRKRQKTMLVVVGALLCAIGIVLIFFNIPCSKTRTEFEKAAAELIAEADHPEDVFQEEDIAGLPEPVQRYFRSCGYLGKPKMAYIKIFYQDVAFSFGRDKPPLKIDYTQYNDAKTPDRIAYIDSSMVGIPFEGLDAYLDGAGSMKGILAKVFPLFSYTGKDMDRSCLVTFLSECLFVPTAALQEFIEWEPVDDLHAKATISYPGLSACGVFTFDENGEMLAFQTEDRSAAQSDGSAKNVPWSVVCGAYREEDGIKRPTVFQAIWHYDDGDLIYFDGKGTITAYK